MYDYIKQLNLDSFVEYDIKSLIYNPDLNLCQNIYICNIISYFLKHTHDCKFILDVFLCNCIECKITPLIHKITYDYNYDYNQFSNILNNLNVICDLNVNLMSSIINKIDENGMNVSLYISFVMREIENDIDLNEQDKFEKIYDLNLKLLYLFNNFDNFMLEDSVNNNIFYYICDSHNDNKLLIDTIYFSLLKNKNIVTVDCIKINNFKQTNNTKYLKSLLN